MTAVVFVGPTLEVSAVRALIDADVLPPVGQGDVYRVARKKPRAIGIIDGYFEGVPSVWHKEILWALEQGIAVFGAASMGALRAAELAEFGMTGVGHIFEAYLSGTIRDDDEVAVLHSPAELGFKPLSEPMVSIRATVECARDVGALTSDAAEALLGAAKALHYRDRTWAEILSRSDSIPRIDKFSEWLPDGRVDAKRNDACEMLTRMATFLDGEGRTSAEPLRVERTLVWQRLVRRVEAEAISPETPTRQVLDELRLDPLRYADYRNRAALRYFALEEAEHRGLRAGREALLARMARHRSEEGLSRRHSMQRWLADNDLDEAGYEELLSDTTRVEDAVAARTDRLEPHFLAELRWAGDYAALKTRAEAKALIMREARGHGGAILPTDRLRLLIWYFETHLDCAVPEDIDAYAISVGLADGDEFCRLIECEILYCKDSGSQPAGGNTD